MKVLFSLFIGFSGLTFATASQAATGRSSNSQDLLIDKLTQVLMSLAPSDASHNSVLLRLADLHSERARVLANDELKNNCVDCTAGDKDRAKALGYYKKALAKASDPQKAKVYLQMGHLYELTGQSAQAENSYQEILKVSQQPIELAEAHLSLGETSFRKSNFNEAISHFEIVLKTDGAASQGLAAYRKSWCHFKLGESEKAIEGLKAVLSKPEFQSRLAQSKGVADIQFLEEVSRDLVTFMAARGLSEGDAETIYKFSPEPYKLQQLVLLGREGLRLGQKAASLKLWTKIYSQHNDAKIRLEAKIRMAQLNFEIKNIEAAVDNYNEALSLWTGSGCTTESCDENYKAIRQFVIGWNRIETQKPSDELISAYKDYIKIFSTDVDMVIWSSAALVLKNQLSQAVTQQMQASQLLVQNLKASDLKADEKKSLNEKLEKNLLLAIETAEKAKDSKLLLAAQNDYLEKSTNQSKSLEVKYQKAYEIYKSENYELASAELKKIALSSEAGDKKIKIQAAELALDALGLLKDESIKDAQIQSWSADFSEKFPEQKNDFLNTKQKSILNTSARLASKNNHQEAFAALVQFDFKAASAADKKLYLKNKFLLEEKLGQITESRKTIELYLKQAGLTSEESQFALQKKAWLAELDLDFMTALKTTEAFIKVQPYSDLNILKLALFAELAQVSPESYYQQFLKNSSDSEKKALIVLKILKQSDYSALTFNKYKSYLISQPELLVQATLETYSRNQDLKLLNQLTQSGSSALRSKNQNQNLFSMAERIVFIKDLKPISEKIKQHQINSKNTKTLSVTLKERVKLLEGLDKKANQAIDKADWTSQVLALSVVASENKRFYDEVLSLPTPEGMTDQEQQEYLMLLSQQVAPHQEKANQSTTKLSEFWQQKESLNQFKKFAEQEPGLAPIILAEVSELLAVAPDQAKTQLVALNSDLNQIVSASKNQTLSNQIQSQSITTDARKLAREELKSKPLDTAVIKKVIDLERSVQSQAFVEYLESRLAFASQNNLPPVQEKK